MQHSVYLSLGSNIHPEVNIPRALKTLSETLTLLQVSSAWSTKAVGTTGPDFVNLAAHISTDLGQYELKEKVLCGIEKKMGRVRSVDKFAPRPIDLDIILYDGLVLEENLLKLDYLILTLSELIPDYVPSGNGPALSELANKIRAKSSAFKLPHFPKACNSAS